MAKWAADVYPARPCVLVACRAGFDTIVCAKLICVKFHNLARFRRLGFLQFLARFYSMVFLMPMAHFLVLVFLSQLVRLVLLVFLLLMTRLH